VASASAFTVHINRPISTTPKMTVSSTSKLIASSANAMPRSSRCRYDNPIYYTSLYRRIYEVPHSRAGTDRYTQRLHWSNSEDWYVGVAGNTYSNGLRGTRGWANADISSGEAWIIEHLGAGSSGVPVDSDVLSFIKIQRRTLGTVELSNANVASTGSGCFGG